MTPKDLIKHFIKIARLIKEKKLLAISIITTGMVIGLGLSFIIKPRYTAILSFAIQDDDKTSGVASLASQFGISLGVASGGAFGGDNLYELLLSRNLIEKSFLCPTTIDGKTDNLLNLYIKTYDLEKKWRKSKYKEVRELKFPLGQPRETFNRAQDSVLQKIIKRIINKEMLTAKKRDKKLSIGDIKFTTENEKLSKYFVENLIREASLFYVETKTKVSKRNFQVLKRQTDSIKCAYEKGLYQKAQMADNALNAVRQTATVGVLRKQADVQASVAAYKEMLKNQEILKLSIAKETPIIEVIDQPVFPLKAVRFGKLKGIVFGTFGGIVLTFLIFCYTYTYRIFKGKIDVLMKDEH